MNTILLVSIFGKNMFSHTCEDNTILKTLEEAVKKGVNLSLVELINVDLIDANLINADFTGADLINVDLRGANLRGAKLRGANLTGANLTGANLTGANLTGADLTSVDLSSADLSGADLSGAKLSGAKLRHVDLSGSDTTNTRLPIYSKWDFSIENDSLNIGCKTKTFSEWKKWFEESEEEFSTERNTEDFNRIQAMFYAYEAYYNFLKK